MICRSGLLLSMQVLLENGVRSQRIMRATFPDNRQSANAAASLADLLRRDPPLRVLALQTATAPEPSTAADATAVTKEDAVARASSGAHSSFSLDPTGPTRPVRADQLLYLRAVTPPEPALLMQMSNLRVLDLSRSELVRGLPPSISCLSCLRHLDVSGCTSLRRLDEGIGALTDLWQLDASGCWSLEVLPTSISGLTSLQQLNVSGCAKLQLLPDSIGALASLQQLDIFDCSSLRALPDSVRSLNGLRQLDLSGCAALLKMPDCISALSGLQQLNLSSCELLAELSDCIGALTGLQQLHISGCASLVKLPDSISTLISLQQLYLSDCELLMELPNQISVLMSLRRLDVSGCASLVELPASMGALTGLQQLDASGCEKLKKVPESISALTGLQQLSLADCPALLSLPGSITALTGLRESDRVLCKSLMPRAAVRPARQLPRGSGVKSSGPTPQAPETSQPHMDQGLHTGRQLPRSLGPGAKGAHTQAPKPSQPRMAQHVHVSGQQPPQRASSESAAAITQAPDHSPPHIGGHGHQVPGSSGPESLGGSTAKAPQAFISNAVQQPDSFAHRLQECLTASGVFVHEGGGLTAGGTSPAPLEGPCRRAQVVVFVVTRQLLSSRGCMDELRWTMDQRARSAAGSGHGGSGGDSNSPRVLAVLHPTVPLRLYSRAQLEAMPRGKSERIISMHTGGLIGTADLDPLRLDLVRLLERHQQPLQDGSSSTLPAAAALSTMAGGDEGLTAGQEVDRVEQCKQDLAALAKLPVRVGDADGRYVPLLALSGLLITIIISKHYIQTKIHIACEDLLCVQVHSKLWTANIKEFGGFCCATRN